MIIIFINAVILTNGSGRLGDSLQNCLAGFDSLISHMENFILIKDLLDQKYGKYILNRAVFRLVLRKRFDKAFVVLRNIIYINYGRSILF